MTSAVINPVICLLLAWGVIAGLACVLLVVQLAKEALRR